VAPPRTGAGDCQKLPCRGRTTTSSRGGIGRTHRGGALERGSDGGSAHRADLHPPRTALEHNPGLPAPGCQATELDVLSKTQVTKIIIESGRRDRDRIRPPIPAASDRRRTPQTVYSCTGFWYKEAPYRARMVREPRILLRGYFAHWDLARRQWDSRPRELPLLGARLFVF
jgi:hypothetical protein